ncbi:hypothetical protein OHT61_00275 [Streptomyces sp. NBC_00178]|uniref:hypothetical protein n=1 Tax=Streptomyces sp. NBC_00178 TaxID=2975672 RepID=UPI002E2DBEFC|nr:hypothetical protein [Streptomyces sp. NBC_00178]
MVAIAGGTAAKIARADPRANSFDLRRIGVDKENSRQKGTLGGQLAVQGALLYVSDLSGPNNLPMITSFCPLRVFPVVQVVQNQATRGSRLVPEITISVDLSAR